jgi:hypothetical protein
MSESKQLGERKRISRWENLQRGKAIGPNHPDPRTRLIFRIFGAKADEDGLPIVGIQLEFFWMYSDDVLRYRELHHPDRLRA